jgi:transcriptional regulator with XRE-family HTH domain
MVSNVHCRLSAVKFSSGRLNEFSSTLLAMVEDDGFVGRRLGQLRGERSQKSLADEMRLRGWKWSQATVWAIERGDRSLKLMEARDLAAVLDIQLDDFFGDPDVLSTEAEFKQLAYDLLQEYTTAVENLRKLQFSHDFLQARMTDIQKDERFKRLLQFAEFHLEKFTVDMAVTHAKTPDSGAGASRPGRRRGLGRGSARLFHSMPEEKD